MPWLYLIAAVVAETVGTTALKASDGFTRWGPSILVVIAYGISFWLLGLVLRSIPVGIAYSIWSGLGIVLIAGIGWLMFGQKLDTAALVGLALIITGIAVIQLFSNSATH